MHAKIELEEAMVAALEAELEAKELVLESKAQSTRALLEEFKHQLKEVKGHISMIEAEQVPMYHSSPKLKVPQHRRETLTAMLSKHFQRQLA
jgi:hypothetical protein